MEATASTFLPARPTPSSLPRPSLRRSRVRVLAAARRRQLATAAASTSNYVVPLDAAPSGITRPLVEILRDLNKRVPDTIVLPASRRASASDPVVPWYHANRMLSFYAPARKQTGRHERRFVGLLGHVQPSLQEAQDPLRWICAVLYPGDGTQEGKLLRLKQQFFLCSASLQDIIFRFKERKPDRVSGKWSEFPSKVAVQMNDTHPTLVIPELMRILMDEEGLGWDEAWDVTNKAVAYTNHTVLPEAFEKWSQAVMRKLLPRQMEIIEEIDKRFRELVISTRKDIEGKLDSMSVLDNSPQKPVVRMANLCVVAAHTVNGVAELHSNILKEELFADYLSIWICDASGHTCSLTCIITDTIWDLLRDVEVADVYMLCQ